MERAERLDALDESLARAPLHLEATSDRERQSLGLHHLRATAH